MRDWLKGFGGAGSHPSNSQMVLSLAGPATENKTRCKPSRAELERESGGKEPGKPKVAPGLGLCWVQMGLLLPSIPTDQPFGGGPGPRLTSKSQLNSLSHFWKADQIIQLWGNAFG